MPRNWTRLMRAAIARKFALTTTVMRRSRSRSPCTYGSKTPIVESFRERLAEGERSELGVLAVGIEERLALLPDQDLLDLAEEDRVAAVHKRLHDVAIERDERVDQHGRPGDQARPVARLEARLAARAAAERGRELPVFRAQHVHAEHLPFRHGAVRAGELVDAREHRRRLGRRRAHRGRRHAVAMPGVHAGDDVHCARQRAHADLELSGIDRFLFHANILSMDTDGFLQQALIYLGAGIIAVPIFTRLGAGSVLGYLVAGIAIGPWGLRLIAAPQTVLQFAELGIVLLLFLVGLELNVARVWSLRRAIFGLGTVQLVVTTAAVAGVALLLGQSLAVGLIAGVGFAMSSTAIGLAVLTEKNLLPAPGGQASFAVLLFQDLAVIPILLALAFLGGEAETFH